MCCGHGSQKVGLEFVRVMSDRKEMLRAGPGRWSSEDVQQSLAVDMGWWFCSTMDIGHKKEATTSSGWAFVARTVDHDDVEDVWWFWSKTLYRRRMWPRSWSIWIDISLRTTSMRSRAQNWLIRVDIDHIPWAWGRVIRYKNFYFI